jgi:hypothetical protein
MEEKSYVKKIEVSEEAKCPSCGRFLGPYESCPHFQASLKKRLSLVLVKRIAVIGSLVGLVMLWYASKMKEIPILPISSITERMNNALIEIDGTIIASKSDVAKNNYNITVDDGTGKIKLNGFNALKDFQKFFGDNLPQEGDKVRVAGQLNISEKYGVSMFIKNPKRIVVINKYVISTKKIKDLTVKDVKNIYRFRVTIEDVEREFSVGKSVSISDGTGSISLTVFNTDFDKITDTATKTNLLMPGAEFDMVAAVDSYRGSIQLKLKSPENPQNLVLLKKGSGSAQLQIKEEESDAPSPATRKIRGRKAKTSGDDIMIQEEEPSSGGTKQSKSSDITIQEEK